MDWPLPDARHAIGNPECTDICYTPHSEVTKDVPLIGEARHATKIGNMDCFRLGDSNQRVIACFIQL